jgi:uncharacterized glyoxalase superfamily protein PhnB
MVFVDAITLDVADTTAANRFYSAAFGLSLQLRPRESQEPTTGFRGFTVSLVVSQPSTVNSLFESALDAGATVLKGPPMYYLVVVPMWTGSLSGCDD